MRRDKLKVVATPADAAEHGRYVLDEQVGFLLRVAMQRHTSIFTSRMIEALTQTQFAALSKLHEVGPCSQNHLGRLIYLDAATIKGVVDRLGRAALSPRSMIRRTAAAARWRSPTAAGRRLKPRCSSPPRSPPLRSRRSRRRSSGW